MYNIEYFTTMGDFIVYYYDEPTEQDKDDTCEFIRTFCSDKTIYLSKAMKEDEIEIKITVDYSQFPISPGVPVVEKD